jgi:hypothetical protein
MSGGMMTPEQFVQAGKALYEADWQKGFIRDLEISYPTVWRYATGRYPIPKKIELAIQRLQQKKKAPR